MVATIDTVLTRPDRDDRRACRGRAPLPRAAEPAAALSRGGAGGLPARPARARPRRRLRRHPARRAGWPGHALPHLLGTANRSPPSRSGSRSSGDEWISTNRSPTIWPAFAQKGKDRVLVRHLLSHRGGFPTTPPDLPRERWGDWEEATAAVAAMPLEHEPGLVSAYHMLTQHWVCAELVRRLDGRSYPDYLREEITGPLGLADTYVGLPTDLEHSRRQAPRHGRDRRLGSQHPARHARSRRCTGW